jgi:GT2 family glycosyltransferase
MTSETAVVILNWNGARLLPACLSALAGQSYRDFELWLVDNGSIDGSAGLLDDLERSAQPEWLAEPLPRMAWVVRNSYNAGFAEGNNIALSALLNAQSSVPSPRYMVALNNDAIAQPGWLGELVSTAEEADRSVGMVASTMLFDRRPERVASAGISIHGDGVALDRGLGALDTALEAIGTRAVFGASAGAALYRSEMLCDVGLFDRRFFSYLEDADLAWRARSRGWKALHNPRAKALHEYSATGGHDSPFKKTLVSRNRVWLLYKNMPEVLLRRHWVEIARYDVLAVGRSLLSGDRHLLKGRVQGLRELASFSEERRKIISSARVHPDEMDAMLAPALTPRQTLAYRRRLARLLNS